MVWERATLGLPEGSVMRQEFGEFVDSAARSDGWHRSPARRMSAT